MPNDSGTGSRALLPNDYTMTLNQVTAQFDAHNGFNLMFECGVDSNALSGDTEIVASFLESDCWGGIEHSQIYNFYVQSEGLRGDDVWVVDVVVVDIQSTAGFIECCSSATFGFCIRTDFRVWGLAENPNDYTSVTVSLYNIEMEIDLRAGVYT